MPNDDITFGFFNKTTVALDDTDVSLMDEGQIALKEKEDKILRKATEKGTTVCEKLAEYFEVKDYKKTKAYKGNEKVFEDSLAYYKKSIAGNSFFSSETDDIPQEEKRRVVNPKLAFGALLYHMPFGRELNGTNVRNALNLYKAGNDAYENTSQIARFFSYFNPFKNKYRDMRNDLAKAKEFIMEKGVEEYVIDGYISTGTLPANIAVNARSYYGYKDMALDGAYVMRGEEMSKEETDIVNCISELAEEAFKSDMKEPEEKLVVEINGREVDTSDVDDDLDLNFKKDEIQYEFGNDIEEAIQDINAFNKE